eukprot:4332295-Alexandrium_andersonii.AAC.1
MSIRVHLAGQAGASSARQVANPRGLGVLGSNGRQHAVLAPVNCAVGHSRPRDGMRRRSSFSRP